jgi:hypothetical protein
LRIVLNKRGGTQVLAACVWYNVLGCFRAMVGLNLDQWLLVVVAVALVRLCFLVYDGVVFLANIVELMGEDDESDIYHPPYEIEGE